MYFFFNSLQNFKIENRINDIFNYDIKYRKINRKNEFRLSLITLNFINKKYKSLNYLIKKNNLVSLLRNKLLKIQLKQKQKTKKLNKIFF